MTYGAGVIAARTVDIAGQIGNHGKSATVHGNSPRDHQTPT